MKLSDGEKLILMMLADLAKQLKVRGGEIDPEFVSHTIAYDYLWGFKWKYSGIPFEREDNPRDVKETADILDMWGIMEDSYKALSAADKKKVDKDDIKFLGFDGNNEPHYGIARYIIDHLDGFQSFKDRELNSHFPSIDGYRRMYRVFEPLRKKVGPGSLLTADDLNNILAAQRHPKP